MDNDGKQVPAPFPPHFDPETAEGTHSVVLGPRRDDGTLQIDIPEGNLEAHADFLPPYGEGQPLTPEYIAAMLERLGIVYGIDWTTIQDTALECNLNRKTVRSVVVARGDSPVDEVREYFEIESGFKEWPRLPDGDVPRVDYREISPFVVVTKGQPLARLVKAVKGREGKDILGNVIPMPVKRPEGMTAGPNARVSGEEIIASCDGRLVQKGTELAVEEVLAVKGAVGYKTGHIAFPGDVIIDGNVADGFKVYSGGSIVAKQTFDATDVVAKKDLIVAGGIIGRGRASIRVGGSIRTKFIQNCHVACRGPILAGMAVINSQIYTLQILDLGDKGRIVGGEVYAVHGVRAAGIGSESGKCTRIHCGVDFTVQQDLDRLNERMRIASMKRAKIRERLESEEDEAKRATLLQFDERLEKDLTESGNRIGNLLGNVDADEKAIVEISGEVSPGTIIEICHIALVVENPLKKVRFRLDKLKGRLTHESM